MVVMVAVGCANQPTPSLSATSPSNQEPTAGASQPTATTSSASPSGVVPSLAASVHPSSTTVASLAPQWSLSLSVPLPLGILFSADSGWVAEHHGLNLIRFDPDSGAIQATIRHAIGSFAQKPFEGNGLVWVPSTSDLTAIDPTTNAIAFSDPGSYSDVGAFALGRVWIGDGADGLLEIDPASKSTVATITSPRPSAEDCLNSVVFADNSLWWSVNDQGLIERLDPATQRLVATILNVGHTVVTAADNGVWVTSSDGTVRQIDESTNKLTKSITYAPPAADQCASPTAADGTTLWLANDTDYNHVTSVNLLTGKTQTFDPGGTDIQDIAVNNGSVWTDFYDANTVVRLAPLPQP